MSFPENPLDTNPEDTPFDEWQEQALASEDTRFVGIDQQGIRTRKTVSFEHIGQEIVQFGLPSAPAIFLGLAQEAFGEYKDVDVMELFDHPQTSFPTDHRTLFNFFGQYAAHVIFAFTALEAWANEVIPESHVHKRVNPKSGNWGTYTGREAIEFGVPLSEKLSEVIPTALNVESPKGSHIWGRYVHLRRVRDRIIHFKAADRVSSEAEVKTLWGDMLRDPKEPFCDNAHKLLGHYGQVVTDRRWFKKYPH